MMQLLHHAFFQKKAAIIYFGLQYYTVRNRLAYSDQMRHLQLLKRIISSQNDTQYMGFCVRQMLIIYHLAFNKHWGKKHVGLK